MRASILRGLSQACLVAGDLALVSAVGLYLWGRGRHDLARQNDGLFVGLWVPTFYILSDRAAIAAAELEEREVYDEMGPEESLMEQYELAQSHHASLDADAAERVPVQSPHPLAHTRHR